MRAWYGSDRSAHLDPLDISYCALRMETIKGEPVTEDDIAPWPDEAEQGYDIDRLRPRGHMRAWDGPGQVIPVRLDKTPPRSSGRTGRA